MIKGKEDITDKEFEENYHFITTTINILLNL